jgi:hypothetical protein
MIFQARQSPALNHSAETVSVGFRGACAARGNARVVKWRGLSPPSRGGPMVCRASQHGPPDETSEVA